MGRYESERRTGCANERPSGSGAAKLVVIPVGESPTDRGGPVTVVVMSSSEEGDQLGESLDVKALCGREKTWSDPSRGASDRTGRSKGESVSPEIRALPETDGRIERESRAVQIPAKANVGDARTG